LPALNDQTADHGNGGDHERDDDAFGDALGKCAPGGIWRDVKRYRYDQRRFRFRLQPLDGAGY